jgi:hypothetical protein
MAFPFQPCLCYLHVEYRTKCFEESLGSLERESKRVDAVFNLVMLLQHLPFLHFKSGAWLKLTHTLSGPKISENFELETLHWVGGRVKGANRAKNEIKLDGILVKAKRRCEHCKT